jgi:uncharacterized protein (DUF2141 family)
LVNSDKGQIIVALFNCEQKGFPYHPECAMLTTVANACQCDDYNAIAVFRNIPNGRYVVMAYHDANSNNRLDLDADNVPFEGYAISGNVKRTLGKPRFDESEFISSGGSKTIYINMQYSSAPF